MTYDPLDKKRSNRISNADKKRYAVTIQSLHNPNWQATCPDNECGWTEVASDYTVSQAAVVNAVRHHEKDAHS